jgi:hypothetical protein
MAEDRTAADALKEQNDAIAKFVDETRENQETPEPETSEEFFARRADVSLNSGLIFGDTDTTAGVSAGGTDVPVADNESATVTLAEADAAREAGDLDDGEHADGITDDQGRRQASGTSVTEEEQEKAAEEDRERGSGAPDSEGVGGVGASSSESDESEQAREDREEDEDDSDVTADEKVEKINAAETVEEVDRLAAQDSRVTVERAADNRREELSKA